MRKTTGNPQVLAQSERRNIALIELLEKGPRTRNEIMHLLNITKDITHALIKRLESRKYIAANKVKISCPISGNLMSTYSLTKYKYDMERANTIFKREEKYLLPSDEIKLREEQIAKEEFYEKAPSHIIKVNEHTTIFLNSKRPPSDYSWQRSQGRRRTSTISIASGMDMFRNWE